jgi:hypothetical protein
MTKAREIYEGRELCPNLEFGQMCFRAMKYNSGKFESLCHEHVPAYRISHEGAIEALRSLVARFSEWPGNFIVHSYLNRRGKNPERYPGFMHHATYPEPGALRQYVSAPTVYAWCDSVLSKAKFRAVGASHDV